jgi:hypothetical protein
MSNDFDPLAALNRAAVVPPPVVAAPCPLTNVAPVITIAAPKIVLVRKAYQATGYRVAVTLTTTSPFTGTASLICPQANVRLFTSRTGTQQQALPWNGIAGAQLTRGITLWIEGATASANMNSTQLVLTLAGGAKTIYNNPALDAMTCVEVTLQLCQYQPNPGAGDRPPVADQINGDRNLHVQTANAWAGRALLVVRQTAPATYPGQVVLRAQNARVRTFPYNQEVAAAGQAPQASPLGRANAALVGAGGRSWIEGVQASAAVRDTGFTLGISDLPGIEGDRCNLTVVGATFDLYDMPTTRRGAQRLIGAGAKLNPGRAVHLQDAGQHFNRAKVVVQRVTPRTWTGQLQPLVWDVTADAAANPRIRLFNGPAAAAAQFLGTVQHPAAVPRGGKELWVEGSTVSPNVRDTQLRLKVADAEGYADAAAITVCQLLVREIYFNSIRPIYYARIPTAGSFLQSPAAEPPATLINPEQVRPAAGAPHWGRAVGANPAAPYAWPPNLATAFSWPAGFVRPGSARAPPATMDVVFDLYPQNANNITATLWADAEGNPLRTNERAVTFANGVSPRVTFQIDRIPNVVSCLDGAANAWGFRWGFDGFGPRTQHTLFVINKAPRPANNAGANQYLWEIFDWSCRWAANTRQRANVFPALWAHFHPVQAVPAHETGLTYWKNQHLLPNATATLAQNLPNAIRSLNPANVLVNGVPIDITGGATCIVFDRILINCCTLHGIDAAEVKIKPPAGQFVRAGVTYTCPSWRDGNIHGQGNTNAPQDWGSHWIASVRLGRWRFYDPSYGDGPVNSPTPGNAGAAIDPISYEPITVQSFNGYPVPAGARTQLPPVAGQPPHLQGLVLWNSV